MFENVPVLWKAGIVLMGAIGLGATLVLGIRDVYRAPEDIDVLSARVTVLDSVINRRLELVQARLEVVSDTARESLRVGRETRCILLGQAAERSLEEIIRDCLR